MKLADIVSKTDKELAVLLEESRTKLRDELIASRTKESKNVKAILAARKQLARTLTIQRQRQLGAQEANND